MKEGCGVGQVSMDDKSQIHTTKMVSILIGGEIEGMWQRMDFPHFGLSVFQREPIARKCIEPARQLSDIDSACIFGEVTSPRHGVPCSRSAKESTARIRS